MTDQTDQTENKHARDALIEAYRLTSDEEEAKKTALIDAGKGEDFVNIYKDPRVRACFNTLTMAVSDEEAALESWDEVEELIEKIVDMRLDESMKEMSGAVKTYLNVVYSLAKERHLVFVTPPPYE